MRLTEVFKIKEAGQVLQFPSHRVTPSTGKDKETTLTHLPTREPSSDNRRYDVKLSSDEVELIHSVAEEYLKVLPIGAAQNRDGGKSPSQYAKEDRKTLMSLKPGSNSMGYDEVMNLAGLLEDAAKMFGGETSIDLIQIVKKLDDLLGP